ncbi:EamA family transporter [Pseudomonas segetis]|uniref:EamA-like transporter family protein n=1 Tax=Pseudomonas segetis TaxID=298908 RepID=A0A238ZTM0_9PSED|nr:EamA family transporter [Pseudomonas segetis]SNR86700.1 EamA-like transporter family protein [Pseudomonas segetis]
MDSSIFFAVLAAAMLHAGWNALIKIGLDRYLSVCLIQIGAGVAATCSLPLLPLPETAAWPWIMLSALLHIGYNGFLAHAYKYGDLSQVYPLSRGSSPLIVALIGVALLHETLSWGQISGLLILVTGIWLMALRTQKDSPFNTPLLLTALTTASFIAAYTLTDAVGARVNGDALSYAMWLFATNGLVTLVILVAMRGTTVLGKLGQHWKGGLSGGVMSLMAYSIVIWAMTLAPVAVVSALRESSVLFALLIGRLVLKETLPALRILSCVVILLGVVTLKLT